MNFKSSSRIYSAAPLCFFLQPSIHPSVHFSIMQRLECVFWDWLGFKLERLTRRVVQTAFFSLGSFGVAKHLTYIVYLTSSFRERRR